MSKNIGWTKKQAYALAQHLSLSGWQADAKKEEHIHVDSWKKPTHQWVVVLQKRVV